jgi:AcrR family transcriptional regulator
MDQLNTAKTEPGDGVASRRAERSLGARGPSERRILEGALRAVARRGRRRLSMSDVCHESGVSRATIYRYYATMEDLLAEVAEFVLLSIEQGLAEVTATQSDPVEKVRAALTFMANYNSDHPTIGLLEIDPVFVVEFLNAHFDRHVAAMQRAVAPMCDMFAEQGVALDSLMLSHFLIRSQLSTMIVPGDDAWAKFPDIVTAFIRVSLQGSDASKAAA